MTNPTISVLVAARKNSKFLAKFIFGYLKNTADFQNTDIKIMLSEEDTWNFELVEYFKWQASQRISFYKEGLGLGRAGLHVYLNKLAATASGEWLIYFCEDHFINYLGWDDYFRTVITGRELDPKKIYCIIPKFGNVGSMNQIVSRGYYEALGGVLGRHGWIDSYINHVNMLLPQDRIIKPDEEVFHDFTHDIPPMMDNIHTVAKLSEEGERMKKNLYDSPTVRELIDRDGATLNQAIINGL